MSNLIGSLLTNADALNVHSLGVKTAGKNIANVNDPAYARQRMILREGGNLQSMGSRTQALGIEALGIEHIRNTVLDSQILQEKQNLASLETQAELLRQLETNINDIINTNENLGSLDGNGGDGLDTGSLSAALDDFLNAFTELASDTESEPLKAVVFQRAEMLIDQFQAMSARLTEFDDFVALEVDSQVDRANDLLSEIADLNERIAAFEAREGVMAPELRDQRQEYLEELAGIIDFTTATSSINPAMIDIFVRQASATATTTNTTTTNTSTNNITLVTGGTVNGELDYTEDSSTTTTTATSTLTASAVTSSNPILNHVDTITFKPLNTTSTSDVEVFLQGGSLEGALKTKKISLASMALSIDALASEVVNSVNTAYGTNTFFDSTKVLASEIDFDSSLFSTITINGESVSVLDPENLQTSSDTTNGGNDLALAIGALVSTKTMNTTAASGGYTFREFVAMFSANLGTETENVENELEAQEVVDGYLREQRESHSGVSIDEEMTDLLRFQRAFQGTSRVITILDNLLEQVVSGLVR